MKINKLKKINLAQFYIQLITAILFAYLSVRDRDIVKMFIAVLLVSQWSLGFWRHKIVRRRLRKWRNLLNLLLMLLTLYLHGKCLRIKRNTIGKRESWNWRKIWNENEIDILGKITYTYYSLHSITTLLYMVG